MPAPKGSQNALKPANERATAQFQSRVKKKDKAKWKRAARKAGKGLSQWAIDTLNTRADAALA